ncbi:hypothetical protein VPH35_126000 [Triticum aestivum]
MGRAQPGALGYCESSFGWEGCCSGVRCGGRARSSRIQFGGRALAQRHWRGGMRRTRWPAAHIVVVHLGVSAYAHGPPRKPPRMLRTGGHRWRSRGGDAPRGYHLTLILLLCWPSHLARGHALAGCFGPATGCLTGRVLPRAPLPGGLPFLA